VTGLVVLDVNFEMIQQVPAVLGDALLLLIEGIYITGQQSEEGPAQSAFTVAKLLIDASVAKP